MGYAQRVHGHALAQRSCASKITKRVNQSKPAMMTSMMIVMA
jgi:hypothetical protein